MVARKLRNEEFSRMRQYSTEGYIEEELGKGVLFCNCVVIDQYKWKTSNVGMTRNGYSLG